MRFVAVTRNTIPAAAARRSAKYSARWPPRACLHRDGRRQQADRADDEAGEGAQPVAHRCAGDDALRPLAVGEEQGGGDGRADEAADRGDGAGGELPALR